MENFVHFLSAMCIWVCSFHPLCVKFGIEVSNIICIEMVERMKFVWFKKLSPKAIKPCWPCWAQDKKNFSFHFKRNYLTIHVVKFCEFFCTCSPSSLEQDPTIESAKRNNLIHLGLFNQKWQFWGGFWEKRGQVGAWHVGAWYSLVPDMFAPNTLEPLCLDPISWHC